MKKTGILLTLGLLLLGLNACTNDEGDPEFDILKPNEETEQVDTAKEESASSEVPLPGE
jgi:hypothetical protein